ncbi:peptide ABC transporter substrate-binding protein [Acidithiobacillus sp.]|jgi:peptide/nickel transport system substrate-binding protein|uniref:peptide ABC transporter substrate-binding protein n=1 Tax=Acidithiobacillus sp. TaxID=1872118 RepID=UPI0025BE8AB8|nr:peptide ABC transporter substrate-binding protein [Acidithiobacillus sp.]MCK9188473.1 peptide ABC transporter substrate-binding protein [Acidithiobacillus sp.]MCK9358894.1 peptide ABC transporter substrate-binding protein [Acidithiobacillus sp.]
MTMSGYVCVLLWGLIGMVSGGTAEASTEIQNGGTITTVPGIGLSPPAAMNGFNPLLTSSAYDSEAESLMYQPLLWINRKFQINYQLSVAKKIIVSQDHRSFTVFLSKSWRWSDGVPVTAADVAYTYHMILKLGPLYPGYGAGGMPGEIKSFSVVNPYEVRVVTKRSVNPTWFELSGLAQLVPYPARSWKNYTVKQMNDNMTNMKFYTAVDGPFRLESFHAGRYVSMVPNRAYSGPDKPHIGRLIFRFLNSNSSVFFALKRGTIQLGNLPAPLYKAKAQLVNDRMVTVGPPWGFNYLGFNFDNPHIAFVHNVLVRQAMMHAINQDLMIKVLGYGHGAPAYGLIPGNPSVFLSPEAKSLLKKEAYDPALADKLLDEAGWHRGSDGIREKNGRRMVFTLYLPPDIIRGPTLLAEMFAKVGIEVNMREKPFNEVYAEMVDTHDKNWQAVYLAWSQSSFPTGGSIFKCDGVENSYHYCNKNLDKLGDQIRIHAGLQPLYNFQNYFTEQQPVIVLPIMKIFVMAYKNIHGLSKALTPTGGFYPQFLWVSHEK